MPADDAAVSVPMTAAALDACRLRLASALLGGAGIDGRALVADLAQTFAVERVGLFLLEGGSASCQAEFAAADRAGQSLRWQGFTAQSHSWLFARLQEGQATAIGSVAELPGLAAAEVATLVAAGAQAALLAPIRGPQGTAAGFIWLLQGQPRRWPVEAIAALADIGRMFGGVISREQEQERLRQRLQVYEEAEARERLQRSQAFSLCKMEAIGQLADGLAHQLQGPSQSVVEALRRVQQGLADIFAYDQQLGLVISQPGRTLDEVRMFMEDARSQAGLEEQGPLARALALAQRSGERIALLGRALGALAQAGNGPMEAIDLNRCIDATLKGLREECDVTADLEARFERALPLMPCDGGAIRLVIINLVHNALHAIRERAGEGGRRGHVLVSTMLAGEEVQIRVQDDGCGMPPEVRARLFEPFFSTKGGGWGSGLGLAVIHKIVAQQHGGRIELLSEVGRGTTFIVSLPQRRAVETEERPITGRG
jgi:signal transduction histidine kinase